MNENSSKDNVGNVGKCGHWIINPDGYYPYCSECQEEPKSGKLTNFCPSCGSDMRDKISKEIIVK